MSGHLHSHHMIDYIEFQVRNLKESKSFYSKVFDWSFNDYGPHYAGIQKSGGGEIGGFEESSSISTGGPLIVLYSDNLEKSLKSAIEAGAKIKKDIFDFPGGQRFQFLDPNGYEIGVWSES